MSQKRLAILITQIGSAQDHDRLTQCKAGHLR